LGVGGAKGHEQLPTGRIAESWDRLRTDSTFHAVLWLSEGRRAQVFPTFPSPLSSRTASCDV
jgi:hypothetical protein